MLTIQDVREFLREFAPERLAETWDNVGLLVGDADQSVERIMTCLTVTPSTVAEAVRERADLIVAHHPLPFRPLKRLTTEDTVGSLLLELIRAGVAVHSPHTSFDSAAEGINQRLAQGLELSRVQPLVPRADDPDGLGAGRLGQLPQPTTLGEVVSRLKRFLDIAGLHVVGSLDKRVETIAVACGSAGEFLEPALRAGCDALVTGETNFHTCLEAEARDIGLLLPGHYASERFAVEGLAEVLAERFPAATVWCSRDEADPLRWH